MLLIDRLPIMTVLPRLRFLFCSVGLYPYKKESSKWRAHEGNENSLLSQQPVQVNVMMNLGSSREKMDDIEPRNKRSEW